MARKKNKSGDDGVLTELITSSFSRSSRLLSLSIKAGADAALLSIKSFIKSDEKSELSRRFLIDQATRLTAELGKLKGSLQKAGQLFSIYGEHFLPPEVRDILKSLQKDSPPVSFEVMMASTKRSLGMEKFTQLSIEPTPIGAASIGQVYKVTVPGDRQTWCMKVQYPGVDKSIDSDLAILKRIFSILRFIPKDMNLDGLFAEIRAMLHREVDYSKEADATEQFAQWLASDNRFVVPEVNREFSTKRVIFTSFQEGFDVDSPSVMNLPQSRRDRLGEAILELFFMEFFKFRTVQTDPHFGNYRIKIRDDGQDQWVLLDFGAVRIFPQSFVKDYHSIIDAVVFEKDAHRLFDALRSLKIMRDDDTESDIQAFYEISKLIAEPFLDDSVYMWGRTQLAQRATDKVKSLLYEQGVRRPPQELIFLDRKIGGLFTILQKLDAMFAPRPVLERYVSTRVTGPRA
jgi:predicted unusual protein kinase regulating ubiquinone biosynthesis (AarF/ABC1/UbiB family)